MAGLLAATALTACDEEFARPPLILPPTDNVETTTTLADFRAQAWADASKAGIPVTTIPGADGEPDSIIFSGRVCSSDKSGNIYQNVVIQSRDSLGRQICINVATLQKNIYTLFPFGQEVTVIATGLNVGPYRQLLQLGGTPASDGQMSKMSEADFTSHIFRRGLGLPEPSKVDTTVTTLAHLNAIKANTDSMAIWQSRLIRVDSVEFEAAGKTFAIAGSAGNGTDRMIRDAEGNTVVVRNSTMSNFAYEKLPYGKGSVVGILSQYNATLQLTLLDVNGVIGFDNIKPKPVTVTSINETFDGGIPASWFNVQVKGTKAWYQASFGEEKYAAMTGYKGTAPFDSWLITPAIDLDNVAEKIASFQTQVNGYGATTTSFKVYVLTESDPTEAKMTELTPALATAPASGYSGWLASGDISLKDFSGIIYIGFQYSATTDANYATWCVDNVIVK